MWFLEIRSDSNHNAIWSINEVLPGFWGNRGKGVFISGEQGNKGQILRETGEQRQYWGTGNIRKQIFDFWGKGEQAFLFQGNKGTGTPWEGLINDGNHNATWSIMTVTIMPFGLLMRPSQGFGGIEEKGYLFQGNRGTKVKF